MRILLIVRYYHSYFLLETDCRHLRVLLRKFSLFYDLCMHFRHLLNKPTEALALHSSPPLQRFLIILRQLVSKPLCRNNLTHKGLHHFACLFLIVVHYFLQFSFDSGWGDFLGEVDVEESPESSWESCQWIERKEDCVLNLLIIRWKLREAASKELVEGIKNILVNEIVINKVDDGWYDECI